MNKRVFVLYSTMVLIILITLITGCGGGKEESADYRIPQAEDIVEDDVFGKVIVNQAIMILEDGSSRKDAEGIVEAFDGQIVGEVDDFSIFQVLLKTETTQELLDAIEKLNALDQVEIAAVDAILSSDDMEGVLWTPTDSVAYDHKDNLLMAHNMSFNEAWRFLSAADIEYVDVKVGVMDSQVNKNSQELKGDVEFFLDFTDEAGRDLSHATKVINIIAADPYDFQGMTGVAGFLGPHLKIYNKNIMEGVIDKNDEKAILFGIMKKMKALMEEGVTIFNCSLGPYNIGEHNANNAEAFKKFAETTRKKYPDVLIVASAGNNHGTALTGTNHYPGGIPASNILTVAALDSASQIAKFSNVEGNGGEVSLAAYGNDVLVGTLGDEVYLYGSGTSFAAPYVTATAALVRSINPMLLSGSELKDFLIETASSKAIGADLKREIAMSQLVNGKVLNIGNAVFTAINDERKFMGDETYSVEELLAWTDIELKAISESDGYRIEASVKENEKNTTKMSAYSDDNSFVEGDLSYEVKPNEKAYWKVSENEDAVEERVWVTREDTNSIAYVILDEALPKDGATVQQSGYPDMMVFDGKLAIGQEAIVQLDGGTDVEDLLNEIFVWTDTIGDNANYQGLEEEYGWFLNDEGIKRAYKSASVRFKVDYHDDDETIERIEGFYKVDDQDRRVVIAFSGDGTLESLTNDMFNSREDGYIKVTMYPEGHLYRYESIVGDQLIETVYYRDTKTIEFTRESRKINGSWVEDGANTSYYRNGAVKSYSEMLEGDRHGLYEKFTEDGTLISSEHYARGLLNGQVTHYEETSTGSGQYYLAMEATYSEGEFNGILTSWHPGMELNYRIEYKDGVMDGLYESYINGLIKFSGQTQNGQAVGSWTEYNEDGSIHGTGTVSLSGMPGSRAQYINKNLDWVYQ